MKHGDLLRQFAQLSLDEQQGYIQQLLGQMAMGHNVFEMMRLSLSVPLPPKQQRLILVATYKLILDARDMIDTQDALDQQRIQAQFTAYMDKLHDQEQEQLVHDEEDVEALLAEIDDM